jgi:hypothetical protein
MIGKPLRFEGKRLLINLRTKKGGYVKVKIVDLADESRQLTTEPLTGDHIDFAVPFEPAELDALCGDPVRLEIEIKNADVFSYKFE